MTRMVVALGVLTSVAVMLATVQVRIELVREGYHRARLEQSIEAEEAKIAILSSALARRTTPTRLRALALLHGLRLEAPRRLWVGPRRANESPRALLAAGSGR